MMNRLNWYVIPRIWIFAITAPIKQNIWQEGLESQLLVIQFVRKLERTMFGMPAQEESINLKSNDAVIAMALTASPAMK